VDVGSAKYEERSFFRKEYGYRDSWPQKPLLDHLIEVDPGRLDVSSRWPNYDQVAPAADRGNFLSLIAGSANFVVNKIPLTFRNQEEACGLGRGRTVIAMRRAGLMATWVRANLSKLICIPSRYDSSKKRGIDTKAKLDAVSP